MNDNVLSLKVKYEEVNKKYTYIYDVINAFQ